MFGSSFLTFILVAWGAVTAVFVFLMIWKSLVGLQEADTLYIDPVEAQRASDQQQVIARVERVTLWAKRFGIASAALLVTTGVIWAYRGYLAFNGGLNP